MGQNKIAIKIGRNIQKPRFPAKTGKLFQSFFMMKITKFQKFPLPLLTALLNKIYSKFHPKPEIACYFLLICKGEPVASAKNDPKIQYIGGPDTPALNRALIV